MSSEPAPSATRALWRTRRICPTCTGASALSRRRRHARRGSYRSSSARASRALRRLRVLGGRATTSTRPGSGGPDSPSFAWRLPSRRRRRRRQTVPGRRRLWSSRSTSRTLCSLRLLCSTRWVTRAGISHPPTFLGVSTLATLSTTAATTARTTTVARRTKPTTVLGPRFPARSCTRPCRGCCGTRT